MIEPVVGGQEEIFIRIDLFAVQNLATLMVSIKVAKIRYYGELVKSEEDVF